MRLLPAVLLVVLASPALAGSPVVPWLPQPWHPPTIMAVGGVRSDPDTPGAPGLDLAAAIAAERAALKATPVLRRADGSRYAIVGGHARHWLVVREGGDGSLVPACVPTEAEAREIVSPPARKER